MSRFGKHQTETETPPAEPASSPGEPVPQVKTPTLTQPSEPDYSVVATRPPSLGATRCERCHGDGYVEGKGCSACGGTGLKAAESAAPKAP